MPKNDYYDVLGVSRDSDSATIKSSYRRLAMKYHPDKNQGDLEAETKFKEISEAYEVLSNPEKKEAYDTYGHDAFSQTGGGFSEGFGGGNFLGPPLALRSLNKTCTSVTVWDSCWSEW